MEVEAVCMTELQAAVDAWLEQHAPEHRGHHVQVGGDGVICHTCPGMLDLAAGDVPAVEVGILVAA